MGQPPEPFIQRWRSSGASERANYQLFLSELCDVLDVPRPDPSAADEATNQYVFEKAVTFQHSDGSTSHGRIDLYKRGCFVLEAKQGVDAMLPRPEPLVPTRRPRKSGHGRRGTARVQAVRSLLPDLQSPITPESVATYFQRARKDRIAEILETLVLLGQARRVDGGFGL